MCVCVCVRVHACIHGCMCACVPVCTHVFKLINSSHLCIMLTFSLCKCFVSFNCDTVYQSLVAGEAGDDKSAVFTAQAMVAFASGDRATCKSLLFKS